jgi:hypothetical protein
MSWHHPDLYFFLGLLTGLAAFLAIIYECIQKFRRRKPPLVDATSGGVTSSTMKFGGIRFSEPPASYCSISKVQRFQSASACLRAVP